MHPACTAVHARTHIEFAVQLSIRYSRFDTDLGECVSVYPDKWHWRKGVFSVFSLVYTDLGE